MSDHPDERVIAGLTREQLQDALLLLMDAFETKVQSVGNNEGTIYLELLEEHTGEELSVFSRPAGESTFELHISVSDHPNALSCEPPLAAVLVDFLSGVVDEE